MDMWSEAMAMCLDAPGTTFPGVLVTNLGPEVRWWSKSTGHQRTWWALCQGCAEPLTQNPHYFDHVLVSLGRGEPDGTDGRGVRPRPTEFDGETCHQCGCLLGNE